jgi:hypothetical protein
MMAVPSLPPQQAILVEARQHQEDVEGCSSVPGFSSGDIDDETKYLIFGQRYGANEFVGEFGNIICELSRSRPITVAVDWPISDSKAFSSYISDPRDDADKTLLTLAVWDKGSTDGRSSQAMFQFVKLLRRLRLAGRDIEVTGCVPSIPGDQNAWEAGIADQLKSISKKGRLVVALMGSLHATKKLVLDPRNVFPPDMIDPAADRLPKEQVISIRFESRGGTGWGLGGPYKLPIYGGGSTLWSRYASTVDGFDGRLFVGMPATVSPPVKQ